MIEYAEEIFPDSLDGTMYERHIDHIAPNDSEDNLSSVTDSASNPSSPQLLHQTSSSTQNPNSPNSDTVSDAFPYHKFTASKDPPAEHTAVTRRLSVEKPGKTRKKTRKNQEKPGKKQGNKLEMKYYFIFLEGWKEGIAAFDYRARSARELALQKGCKVFLQKRMRYAPK